MPSAIELDTKRWSHVVPVEDEAVTVTARGFACYYSNEPQPPEKASEGTELTEGSSLTIENPSGRWFRAKEPASTEVPFKPVILEVTPPPGAEGEQISTAMIDKEAVTAGKLGPEAVTGAKIKTETIGSSKIILATIPVPSASENVQVLGVAGVPRKITAAYTGNGAETKAKIKHELGTQATVAFAQKSTTKLPTELPTTALGKWVPENANEGTYTFTAAPAAKEEVFVTVLG